MRKQKTAQGVPLSQTLKGNRSKIILKIMKKVKGGSQKARQRRDVFKYLAVLVNETLSWSDHVDYVISKVGKRLGMLQRIKHLLPVNTRKLLINALILPILDYGDIVWGDKSNITLMNKIQIIHNRACEISLGPIKVLFVLRSLEKIELENIIFERRKKSSPCFYV